MAKFCPNCGSKIYDEKKFCSDCGCEVDADIIKTPIFTNFTNNTSNHNQSNNGSIEIILGIIGGVTGLLMGLYSLYITSVLFYINPKFDSLLNNNLGLSNLLNIGGIECIIFTTITLIASVVTIGSTIFLKRDPKLYGTLLILSSIGFIFTILWFGYIPFIITLIAGILTIIRR